MELIEGNNEFLKSSRMSSLDFKYNQYSSRLIALESSNFLTSRMLRLSSSNFETPFDPVERTFY